MRRYAIWNKTDHVITPRGEELTAEQWLARYPWAGREGVKMVISAGVINGGVALEFEATKAMYQRMGAAITDEMTDDEVLQAIEDFEDNPPEAEPTVEERIAAALEYQNLMNM